MVSAVVSHTDRMQWGVNLYLTGMSHRAAADQSGTSPNLLYQHLRATGQVRQITRAWQRQADPTESEILARAAEIRAGWTPEEASRRWVGKTHGKVINRYSDRRRGRVA